MSLTGNAFLCLVTGLTVASFAAVVFLWPRLSSNRLGTVLGRAGMLFLVNVLVLLTAGTVLNSQNLFFSSWTDLGGAAGMGQASGSISRGASASGAASRQFGDPVAQAATSLPPLHGVGPTGLVTYSVHGRRSGLAGEILVQLPAGYLTGHAPYPVIETFSGYPGTPAQWVRTMKLRQQLQRAVSAHRIREALIVSPETEFPLGTDTECVNGTAGHAQVETWLAEDVPTWVAHTFRVQTARSSWATIGLSAGGWCAAMVTMLHPAQYAAAVVMGGYFRPLFGPLYAPYPDHDALAERYDLVALAGDDPPPVAIWLQTSRADPTSFPSSQELLAATHGPTAVDATVLHDAGHRIGVWQGLLPSALTWLGANVPGFRPAA